MTAGATQPARLVCHMSLFAGREKQLPKVPPWCHLPPGARSQGLRQAGSIPASLGRPAGKGNSRSAWRQRGRAGREEGTGTGSRGARPVGAAPLFSMGGAYLCHRLGLITGTCLQPRRLPASVIASNRAGLGSPAHPRAFTAAASPAQAALPRRCPTALVALGWGPCATRGWGQAGTASPAEPPEHRRGLINSKAPRDYTNAAWRLNEPSTARECHPPPTGKRNRDAFPKSGSGRAGAGRQTHEGPRSASPGSHTTL